MTRERPLLADILLRASAMGARWWRNNTGLGWVGIMTRVSPTRIALDSPRPLHAGLCEGSSDIIGITPVVVTQEMVGTTVGLFTAVEVKVGKTATTPKQKAFLRAVAERGGLAMIARDEHEAAALIDGASFGLRRQLTGQHRRDF